ncbi:MAG: HAMP domain-containing protein [Desulfobacteraceae bacterium]|nr:HAMP domain-containing protein [Desulfobacteraceae bacterium]
MNEKQIKSMSEYYLSRIASDQAKNCDAIFKKIIATSALMARHATCLHNSMELLSTVPLRKRGTLKLNPKNKIFFSPGHEPVVTAFWGDNVISEEINIQLDALTHLEPMLIKSKELVNESLATHIILTSGIGCYYTMNPEAKFASYNLPSLSEFDLRNGEPLTIFTKGKTKFFDTQWTSIYKDDVIDDLMMTATTPIYDKKGEFKGIAGIDIPVGYITDDLIKGSFVSGEANENILFAFLQNMNGKIIAFPREFFNLFGLEVDFEHYKNSGDIFNYSLNDSTIASVRKISSQLKNTNNGILELMIDKQKYVLAIGSLGSLEWNLILVAREKDIMTSVHKTQLAMEKSLDSIWKDFIGYSLLVVIFSVLSVACVIWLFISPIKQFIEATRKVSKGDFSSTLQTDREDEIGMLAKSFNGMIEKLKISEEIEKRHAQELENRIKLRTTELEKSNDELNLIKKELEKTVEKRTVQLKKLNEHLVYTEEGERKAIASDLHDSVTQTLAMSISKIKNIQELNNSINQKNFLEIQGYLEQAVGEIRSLIYKLSPPILDDFDIEIALGFLIEEMNTKHHTHFFYSNTIKEPVKVDQAVKVTLYRAVNELMMNSLKHSGSKDGQIEISFIKGEMIVSVEDHGVGFDVDAIKSSESFGFGLRSLSERMENLGGKIQLDSNPDEGTSIHLTVPISPNKENDYEKS